MFSDTFLRLYYIYVYIYIEAIRQLYSLSICVSVSLSLPPPPLPLSPLSSRSLLSPQSLLFICVLTHISYFCVLFAKEYAQVVVLSSLLCSVDHKQRNIPVQQTDVFFLELQ